MRLHSSQIDYLKMYIQFHEFFEKVKFLYWRCYIQLLKMQVEGGRFVQKSTILANIWDGWTKFQNFFTRASWGVWLKMTKKNLVPGLARPAGPGCKVAKVEPSLVENWKITIFMYAMSKNLNCLRVICMPYGSKNFFWPNWPTLGTPGHPRTPLEVA